MSGYYEELTDVQWAMLDRQQFWFLPMGPLTRDQQESMEAYERYCEEMNAEYEAQDAAGGRTICPSCGQRSVTHRSVITLGHEGHPGSEYSDLAECESCDYKEL